MVIFNAFLIKKNTYQIKVIIDNTLVALATN